MSNHLPSREEIREKLVALRTLSLSREDASKWAMTFIENDDLDINDPVAWDVVKALGGADLHGGDRPYLYGNEDFITWENKLTAD